MNDHTRQALSNIQREIAEAHRISYVVADERTATPEQKMCAGLLEVSILDLQHRIGELVTSLEDGSDISTLVEVLKIETGAKW